RRRTAGLRRPHRVRQLPVAALHQHLCAAGTRRPDRRLARAHARRSRRPGAEGDGGVSERVGRCAIAIMAKAPDAGRVKTRLLPLLRPDEARELSSCFLRDMTQMLTVVGGAAPMDGSIAFAPAGSEANFAPIVAPGTQFVLADGAIDAPADVVGIGRSLLQAARALFADGYGTVGLLNADSPNLPAAL